jgi:phosphatidylserine/phosphatidylglycerophosphate/cardiolipin synthase-like enzyme
LLQLVNRGVKIEILAHDTERRVPSWVEDEMLRNGIVFRRYIHPEGLPMHNKFMLIETPECGLATFGSLNLSVQSLHANHELLVISENPACYQAFQNRWDEIKEEMNNLECINQP